MGYFINSTVPAADALAIGTGGAGLVGFLRHIGEPVDPAVYPEGELPAADVVARIDAMAGIGLGDEVTRQRVSEVYALATYSVTVDRAAVICWG